MIQIVIVEYQKRSDTQKNKEDTTVMMHDQLTKIFNNLDSLGIW